MLALIATVVLTLSNSQITGYENTHLDVRGSNNIIHGNWNISLQVQGQNTIVYNYFTQEPIVTGPGNLWVYNVFSGVHKLPLGAFANDVYSSFFAPPPEGDYIWAGGAPLPERPGIDPLLFNGPTGPLPVPVSPPSWWGSSALPLVRPPVLK